MNSIIKKYTSENDEDQTIIHNRFLEYMSATEKTVDNNIGQKLAEMLSTSPIPSPKTLMFLAQPWIMSHCLVNFLNSFKLSEEKEKAKDLCAKIKKLKETLKMPRPKSLDFLLIETASEPKNGILINYLTEYESHLEQFTELMFQHGQPYTPDFLKRYAIESLIWIGKMIGLNEDGCSHNPSRLSRYIQVVTERSEDEIQQDRHKYRERYKVEEAFLSRYKQNKNGYLQVIFDPTSSNTIQRLRHLKQLVRTSL